MTEFRGVLSLQVDSILERLRQRKDSRCGELIRQAEAQARDLVQRHRRELYQRAHEAVDEERLRRGKTLQQTRHRIGAAEGQKVQALYADLLSRGWPELIAELEGRWQEPAARRAWCGKLLDDAARAFAAAVWTIEHPGDWTERDADWLTETLGERGIPIPKYRHDEASSAGLRIIHGTACLDGTIDGLLADRTGVEARLLAAWERHAPAMTVQAND